MELHGEIALSIAATTVAYALVAAAPWITRATRANKAISSICCVMTLALIVPAAFNSGPLQEAQKAIASDRPMTPVENGERIMFLTHLAETDAGARKSLRAREIANGRFRPLDPVDLALPEALSCGSTCQRALATGSPSVLFGITTSRSSSPKAEIAVAWSQASGKSGAGAQWLLPSTRRSDGLAVSPVLQGRVDADPDPDVIIKTTRSTGPQIEIARTESLRRGTKGALEISGRQTTVIRRAISTPLALRFRRSGGHSRIEIWRSESIHGESDPNQAIISLLPGAAP